MNSALTICRTGLVAAALFLIACGKNRFVTDDHAHQADSHGEHAHTPGEVPHNSAPDAQAHGRDLATDDGHAGHDHAEDSSGAEFKQGAGILLAPPARETIGLETAQVASRELALRFTATARLFHAAHQHGDQFAGHKDGHAYANAIIPVGTADLLRVGQPVELQRPAQGADAMIEGQLKSLDRETARAIGQVEAVIEIPDPSERLEFGAFLTVRFAGAERTATVIPRSALVDAATGTFVYAQNGARWLRTPVKIGGSNDKFVEILHGLVEGDTVVSKGAVDLWLIELRFTKGGGHSH
jgi:hypothetical protein